MKVQVRFLVIIALLALAMMPMQHAAALNVDQHIICHSVDTSTDNWWPVNVSDEFTTADEKVMAFLDISDINPPIDTLTVWVGPDGTQVGESEFHVTEWASMISYRTLEIKGELSVGEWQHRLYVDGKLASSAEFTIEPSIELVGMTLSHTENDTIYPGDIVTASYELENTGGTDLRDVEITVGDLPSSARLVKSALARDLSPGETGSYVLEFEFEKEGEYGIDLKPLVNGYLVRALAGTLTVSVSPMPLWQNPLVIAGVVAAIVVVLALILLMRRRGKAARPQTLAPAAAPSPIPPPVQPTARPDATKYCISCGALIPAHALHCSRCGAAQQ